MDDKQKGNSISIFIREDIALLDFSIQISASQD